MNFNAWNFLAFRREFNKEMENLEKRLPQNVASDVLSILRGLGVRNISYDEFMAFVRKDAEKNPYYLV